GDRRGLERCWMAYASRQLRPRSDSIGTYGIGKWSTKRARRRPRPFRCTTDRMNDYDAVVMGVLEPILVLSVMAVIAFLCGHSLEELTDTLMGGKCKDRVALSK